MRLPNVREMTQIAAMNFSVGPLRRVLPILAGAVAIALGLFLVGSLIDGARQSARTEAEQLGRNDAAILAAGLQAELEKFTLAPLVLADDADVRAVLTGGGADGIAHLNRRFEALALQTNAAAIYLMDANGMTLAASNWQLPTTFVGSNYRFRRYFTESLRDGSATQFALGTVSRKPGLYIAQAVRDGARTVGIVAVKVEFDSLEKSWRETTPGVFVTDRDGAILITSREAWRFHTIGADRAQRRDNAQDRRQFGVARLQSLDATRPNGQSASEAALIDTNQPIALPGWRLHLLVDPTQRMATAVANLRFWLLLFAAGTTALIVALALLRRQRAERAKRIVAQQTLELREQLGQANRLALLGQITAGVGHEINQPVAAARVYAESGIQLLDRGRVDEARTNFGRIIGIAERIGTITGELRRFGRRSSTDVRPVPVGRPIDGALLLLHDRIMRSGANLRLPPESLRRTLVRSETVKLEQVLVNLLQNALDAVGDGGAISLVLTTEPEFCLLSVEDDGPGLGEIGARIFQPFATTKQDGLGLGLVISRDIMRDLGGDLELAPSERGACFVMRIPRA
jgi:two-component system C4-dicarboxylate transport sensor histidine kinase DctB